MSVTRPRLLDLLANPSFLRLWLAGGLTGTVRWLEMLALGVTTFTLTGSPGWVALITFARLGPMLVLGLGIGALAERFDRRRLLLFGLVVLGFASVAFALIAAAGRIALWHLALSAFLNGVLWAGEFALRRTMMVEIVGPGRLAGAMALESLTSNATRALGPLFGGALLQLIGLQGAFWLSALAYAVAVLLVLRVHARPEAPSPARLLSGIREGLAFVRHSRPIAATLMVTVVFNVFGFAYMALVPVVGERWLQLSPFLTGVLMSVEGVGALIGSLLVGQFARPESYARIYLIGTAIFLAMIVLFALSRSFPLSLLALFGSGFGLAGFAVMQSTLMFAAAPAAMRSRMMGVLTVAIGTGPLAMLLIGWLAELIGAPHAILLLASSGLLALALCVRVWPELIRVGPMGPT